MFRFALYALVLCLFSIPSIARAGWPSEGVVLGSGLLAIPVVDGAGGATVAWTQSAGDVYAQRINGSGAVQFTANGVSVCAAAGGQTTSTVIPDGAGGAIATWTDARGANQDVYVQWTNASGTAQWATDGVALCTATNHQTIARIAPDGAGGAIVAWRDLRSGTNYDVYAQRVDVSGAVQWTANGVAISTAMLDQWEPAIVEDGAGGAIVTWADRRTGNHDIYAQRINASGTVQWTANGLPVCVAPNTQAAPMVISDGAGGAIIAWVDGRSGNQDIYAQRINGAGQGLWTANGVALCAAANNQSWPGFMGSPFASTIVTDGAGGAIVTWADRRISFDDIYVQRIDASGAVQWLDDGVALCTAEQDQNQPAIAPDGNGGAIVAWRDTRLGSTHIYAQRIDATGAVQWAPDGVQPSTLAGTPHRISIVSDGAGGAIVTWDHSSGNVYAQRLGPSGLVPTGIGDTPPASVLSLHPSYPNPFSAGTTMTIQLPADSDVAVDVLDASGRRVRALRPEHRNAGWSTLQFDGRDATGRALPNGVYFYRVTASGTTITKKMVIAR